ncbi:hypothetical protein D4R86_01145 [bacterium]|nr:MAG: hypothetical protein D4R86_01145 [bacterium]
MAIRTWTTEILQKLDKLRNKENKPWKEIAKVLGKSENAILRKHARTDWDAFNKKPGTYLKEVEAVRRWNREEMVQLDAFLQTEQCSYAFIAEKLGRSITSVERQAQTTNWEAWRALPNMDPVTGNIGGADRADSIQKMVNSINTLTRCEYERLEAISEKTFLEKVNLDKEGLIIPFKELKELATKQLDGMGLGNPECMDLGKGRYVVLGDSHGKYTSKSMFKLLTQINKTLKPDKIIHIGHIVDDDDDISYEWGNFHNLVILAKSEELQVIQNQRNKYNFRYSVVRGVVNLGSLAVINQDMIQDYSKQAMSGLDAEIFEDKAIFNNHRREFFPRCTNEDQSYLASPGCICERHIIKTIKQIDFTDGKHVKQAKPESFIKYRRNKHLCKYWSQGLIVVEVDKEDNHTLIPCPIIKTKKGHTTSYFDKIISSSGVFKPQHKIFVNGDVHSDKHDCSVLDIQEAICADYKPDTHVNVGDTHNYLALNHHVMDRGETIWDQKVLDEAYHTHYVLKRMRKWAKKSYLIYGNHERFATDFVAKFPQFGEYLDFRFLCGVDDLDYDLVNLKGVLKIGPTKFVHGEVSMHGQTGSKLEKASKTFGGTVFIGHVHYPAIRYGCLSVGLSGELNQDYNEPMASTWIHGFGLCNHFDGKSFPTTLAIIKNKILINGKAYIPSKKPQLWKPTSYKAKIVFEDK